jgi:RNA polymerase-binding transcription factor DksA
MTNAERQAKYLEAHRESINFRKRARYWLNVEKSREALRDKMRKRYAENAEHRSKAADNARKSHLWNLYRLTPEAYAKIEEFQGGVCAACGKPSERVRLAVDHEHSTGRVRGLLCWICNRALGYIRDRQEIAEGLALYLQEPPAPIALGKETYGMIGKALKSKKVKIYGPPAVAVVIGRRGKK